MQNYFHNWRENFDKKIMQTAENRRNNPSIEGNYSANRLSDAIPLIGVCGYIMRKASEEGAPRNLYENLRFTGTTVLLSFWTATSSLLLFPELVNDMKKGLEIILS
jgi:hypothetical protein